MTDQKVEGPQSFAVSKKTSRLGLVLLALVASIGAAAWLVQDYRERSKQRAEGTKQAQIDAKQAQIREDREVLIEDDTTEVKRKMGLPSNSVPEYYSSFYWIWENQLAVRFSGELPRVYEVLIFGDSVPWVPADGLMIRDRNAVDSTLRRFKAVYGPPCSTVTYDSSIVYGYKIPANDRDKLRKPRYGNAPVVRRLEVSLANGRKLASHGWALESDYVQGRRCGAP